MRRTARVALDAVESAREDVAALLLRADAVVEALDVAGHVAGRGNGAEHGSRHGEGAAERHGFQSQGGFTALKKL